MSAAVATVVNVMLTTKLPESTKLGQGRDVLCQIEDILLNTTMVCNPVFVTKTIKKFSGRPSMIVWKLLLKNNIKKKNKMRKTILFFPNRSIQLLGLFDPADVTSVHEILKSVFHEKDIPFPLVRTMTVVYDFYRSFNLSNVSSSHNCLYEVDIFPAVQLSRWAPIHVTLFHTGKGVFTGVKKLQDVYTIVEEICNHFHDIVHGEKS